MFLTNLALGLIKAIVFVYTLLTYPLYAVYYGACRRVSRRLNVSRARVVSRSADEVTLRAIPYPCSIRDEILSQSSPIKTMDKLFQFAVKQNGGRKALGTRPILAEEKEKSPSKKVFTKLVLGDYEWMTYNDLSTQADRFGRGIRELGVKPRDKVCVFADTRAEWMVAATGCFRHSIALATIYTNLGDEGIVHGIQQTQVTTVITAAELLPKLVSVLRDIPTVKNIVYFESPHKPAPEPVDGVTLHPYSRVIELGSKSALAAAPPTEDDTAIIMYTSGSTGVPKGVVLTHGNMVSGVLSILPLAFKTITAAGPVNTDDAYIAFLPLAHVLEMLAEQVMLLIGVKIGYSSPNTLTDKGTLIRAGDKGDATLLKPTVMAAVPLILDRIYKGIKANIASRGAFSQELVNFCIEYRRKWVRRGYNTPIMNRLIFSKMKSIIGGRLRVLLSGGAPLSDEAHEFIRTCLTCTLHQGYGLTETCSTACITDTGDFRTGHVGPPLIGVDLKIVNAEDLGYTVVDEGGARGEVVIGGPHIAKGYYNMPEKTAEEFFQEDGKTFFRTGDIGQVLQDGSIKIIDRKKDLVKLQGGEYVSLGKVEAAMKTSPLVDNLCVYGDSKTNAVVGILVPEEAQLKSLAETELHRPDMSLDEMCLDPGVIQAVTASLMKHGQGAKLQKFEIPKQFRLASEAWTPESGLVTAAFKLKRKPIQQKFQAHIDNMYESLANPDSVTVKFPPSGKIEKNNNSIEMVSKNKVTPVS